ncbi:MAG TPA: sulfur transferase domain-containing protein [Gaiellales bacterium]
MARLPYSRLNDHLLAGPMPHAREHVEALRAEGVVVVVNLCEEREYWDGERETIAEAYRDAGIRELHLPVKDGSTVPHDVIDAAVEGMQHGVVYVHCRGGRERSATVATALLAASEGVPIDEALERARAGRPIFRPLPWQLEGLQAWAARSV